MCIAPPALALEDDFMEFSNSFFLFLAFLGEFIKKSVLNKFKYF